MYGQFPCNLDETLVDNEQSYSWLKSRDFKEETESRLHLKCDGIRAETRFRLLANRTSPFQLAGASVQSTTGS
jgi:hypothetical protein